MTTTLEPPAPTPAPEASRQRARKRPRRRTQLSAHGEPFVWISGGALVLALAMVVGLFALVLGFGLGTFWPGPLEQITLEDGTSVLGELQREETVRLDGEEVDRRLIRVGNRDLTGVSFRWIDNADVAKVERPDWALVVERLSWGRFYGTPVSYQVQGEVVTEDPAEVWSAFLAEQGPARERLAEIRTLEEHEIGRVNARLERARLATRGAELRFGEDSDEARRAKMQELRIQEEGEASFAELGAKIAALRAKNAEQKVVFRTSDGVDVPMEVASIVRAYPANRLSFTGKVGVYLARWWEFLSADPRESNMEGGVFPAILGTVSMTLLMSILVVPFGVLAALYLREYAKQGIVVSTIRIVVNNLAGVPSIVFGVFGLGFFCYVVGGSIDRAFFPEALPDPTFGKRGLIWAALTLALLTLPVVIVATEEALAAVPSSMREGSLACGATKWQTIRRIVLPRAAPGIMTGMVLAIARGAGEVAPLMLVGAVKLAPSLPVDLTAPFVHPSRSFMHLGFHIFDLGFQSPDSEAAKPMIYTTTLLLIVIILALNSIAFWVRGRLRRKLQGVHV
ncbi:MAG TPA: phosphate ABC transporter permease PstA [Planctomycetes bacterium]|nr:phosphate ABC transporter permease PstA [Planctomycetota bacterium]